MRPLTVTLLLVIACSIEPPPYSHDEPDESSFQTCVLCHSCGTDGTMDETAPIPGNDHAVCGDCHATDPVEHECDASCDWDKTCEDQVAANCASCHAAGVPKKTITQVNDACRWCHDRAE